MDCMVAFTHLYGQKGQKQHNIRYVVGRFAIRVFTSNNKPSHFLNWKPVVWSSIVWSGAPKSEILQNYYKIIQNFKENYRDVLQ